MGCHIGKKKITLRSTVKKEESLKCYNKFEKKLTLKENNKKKNICGAIRQSSWLNVIDFLKYDEIKEVGKANKMFNYLVKQTQILIKFFKKKESNKLFFYRTRSHINIKAEQYKKALESFSVLQKENSINSQNEMTTTIISQSIENK